MKYFLALCSLMGVLILCGFSDSDKGEDCYACHVSHHNKVDKLIRPEAIQSGVISCFDCHTSRKSYGAPDTEREFNMAHSRHPADGDRECTVCHVLDEKHNDGYLDTWPNLKLRDPDPEDSHIYQGEKINDFCLSCHDNSPITLGSPPRTPIDLASGYEFSGHGRIDINEPCTSCHTHHASVTKPHLIKDVINYTMITGNDNTVCFACHSQASDHYPGQDTYLSSEHGLENTLCVDCHNPHGDNKDMCYLCHSEQYSAHYSNRRDKLCIDCHNPHQKADLKMTKEDEEKLCFICHKELEDEFGNVRDGVSGNYSHHKVDDEEYGGGRVECSECHNPHVVNKFNIVSDPRSDSILSSPQSFPEDAYDFMSTQYDDFCLGCHDGARMLARDIKSELISDFTLETEFTADGQTNLHKMHQEKQVGCQNCHDAHASQGTGGIKRGALLHEEITVESWDSTNKYYEGKNSCSTQKMGVGCHQSSA